VDRLAYPLHWPTAHSHLFRRQGLPVECHLVMSMGGGVCRGQGEEASRGTIICWKFCPLWYLFIKYYIVNGFLPGGAHTLAR
jgi:hypothetical protein